MAALHCQPSGRCGWKPEHFLDPHTRQVFFTSLFAFAAARTASSIRLPKCFRNWLVQQSSSPEHHRAAFASAYRALSNMHAHYFILSFFTAHSVGKLFLPPVRMPAVNASVLLHPILSSEVRLKGRHLTWGGQAVFACSLFMEKV